MTSFINHERVAFQGEYTELPCRLQPLVSNLPLYQVVHSVLTYDDSVPAQSRTSQREPILEAISRTRLSGQLSTMWLDQVYNRKSKNNYMSSPATMSKTRGSL